MVGLVENMPGGNALRPGDILKSYSGKTVEVLNTDAEGRLVLADALTYTEKIFKPKFIIDLATLTGAIIVSLGSEYAGLFSNDDKLSQQIFKSGEKVEEKVWRMPLHKNYDKLMNSKNADMQNINYVVPASNGDLGHKQSLNYMQIEADKPIIGKEIDVVFIGSCTNSGISDLQDAAEILKGRKVSNGVRALVVPGSQAVKKEAESLGLDKIFESAGAEWRESGCSMCLGMNGDTVGNGQLAVSTSNRNFEGRQGKGARTILASPKTAAASAIAGSVDDPRKYS